MDIQQESVYEFQTGKVTATTTPQALPSFPVCKGVKLKNAGAEVVLVGDYRLEPGQRLSLPLDDAAKVTVQTESSTSDVHYLFI